MSAVIGIDPGLSGALARYDLETTALLVEDMPVFKIGSKTVIDALGLARLIDVWGADQGVVAFLEFVASSPQMGVASAFKFGEGCGIVKGVLAANFVRVESVTPPAWKRAMGVKADKDGCRAVAAQRFPRQSGLFARKKDDGRAEAALIALYGAQQAQRP